MCSGGDICRQSTGADCTALRAMKNDIAQPHALAHRRALADAAQDELSVFQPFNSQFSPPDVAYAVVSSSAEFLSILNAGEGLDTIRFARISNEIQHLDITGALSVPTNAKATVDCQGAILSFESTPPAASQGSELDMFSCSILNFPETEFWAEQVTLSDAALVYPCQVW